MENPIAPHHMSALKHFFTLSLLALAFAAQSQTLVGQNELQYDGTSKLYYLRSQNKPYTGRSYTVNYYSVKDTTNIQGYTRGRMDYTHYYSNKKLYYSQTWYNAGFKNDSICYEYVAYDQGSGDTSYYEYHWVNKKKEKWARTNTYYYGYQRTDKKNKQTLATVQYGRFFHKNDTKDFTDYNYRQTANYDSAGYYATKESTGPSVTYYNNGNKQVEGYNCVYENKLKNKGQYVYNYQYCGAYRYYDQNGVLTRIDEYVAGSNTVSTTYYHPNGKIMSRSQYKKMGSEIKLPPTNGIPIAPYEEYNVFSTSWHPNGQISVESIRNAKGDVIAYSYYEDGKPMSVTAYTGQNKPYGIHKSWDAKGNCVTYDNYSYEWTDTLCYRAASGKISALNLRDRSVKMNWEQMPLAYTGTEVKNYLYMKSNKYKTFYNNGKVKMEVELKNGKMNGLYHEYDSTGSQVVLATYREDVADGAWTEWYANGKMKKSYTYKNGVRNGNCTEYYQSGQVKWENIYENGVAGSPKAYSENGTLLSSKTYLHAFYSPSCIETQARNFRGAALHYYFLDTTLSNSSVTIPDSMVDNYTYKVIAMTNAITPGYDLCDAKSVYAPENGLDIYHSCFVLSKSLYTETNLNKIKAFFGRHGLTMDKTEPSDNPVLGLEKEYLVYYSGKQMLNKRVIIDSLETYLAPRAIDASQGYVLSVDNNVPQGSLTGVGSQATMTSDSGHVTIRVESGIRYPSYPAYDTWNVKTYYVYDDLTCDILNTQYNTPKQLYWAGK
jgi:antitoxin component YwqK of YwqJK toxin-antitoxin module